MNSSIRIVVAATAMAAMTAMTACGPAAESAPREIPPRQDSGIGSVTPAPREEGTTSSKERDVKRPSATPSYGGSCPVARVCPH